MLALNGPYQGMAKEKDKRLQCQKARTVFERLDAHEVGAAARVRQVHPPTADQMLGLRPPVRKVETQSVQRALPKCSPSLLTAVELT